MTREEMIQIIEEVEEQFHPEHDSDILSELAELRRSIGRLTVRIEASLLSGVVDIDVQGDTDFQVIYNYADHDAEFFEDSRYTLLPHHIKPSATLQEKAQGFVKEHQSYAYDEV